MSPRLANLTNSAMLDASGAILSSNTYTYDEAPLFKTVISVVG